MISGSSKWYVIGGYLRDAVKNGLTAKPGRISLYPGEVAWDQCDCDGMLAVTLVRVFYSEDFPEMNETVIGSRCDAPYEVGEYHIEVIRCMPGPQSDGAPPDTTDLDNAAGLQFQDTEEALTAAAVQVCILKDADSISDYLVGPAEILGPEGDCGGVGIKILIGLERV